MPSYQRSELRTRSRAYADMPSTTYVSDALANEWLDLEYFKFYRRLIDAVGSEYVAQTVLAFTSDGITEILTLPADFGIIIALDYRVDVGAGRYEELKKLHPKAANDWDATGDRAYAWRLNGTTQIVLYPRPPANQVYRLRYYAAPAKLAADGSTVEGFFGWEDAIPLGVGIRMRLKEKTDATDLKEMYAAVYAEMDAYKSERAILEPGLVRDVDDYDLDRPRRTGDFDVDGF